MNIDFLNVLDADRVARGEALTDDRTKFADGFDIGDRLRQGAAFLLGKGDQFSEEALRKKAADYQRGELDKLLATDRVKARQLGGSIPGANTTDEALKVQVGETATEAKNRLAEMQLTGQALSEALITNPGMDISKLGPGATVSTINALRAADSKRQLDEAKREKEAAKTKEENRYIDLRRDQLMDRQDARRAENRRYELEIMRLQQADKQKAQDRRDRMIMTLMSGLNNLGQAFTI